jgi:hypothetical protein
MKKVLIDIFLITLSIAAAIYIVQSGAVHAAISWAGDGVLMASLVAGLFFTSFFTTAPAIAVFVELSQEGNIFLIAPIGGLGAMLGDYLLFSLVRDHIAKDAGALLRGKRWRALRRIFKNRLMQRILPVVGAIIVASPFPDEIGLALMGISKLTTGRFLLISYVMNTLGILIIGLMVTLL